MEEIIDMVNNIFDAAYFKALNQAEVSYTESFFLAEREYCEDKEIEFLELQLHDHDTATRIYEQREIEILAKQHYQWRIANNHSGDEKSDWSKAERQYPKWRMQKRIATICWNLAEDKQQHQDYYWGLACTIIRKLEDKGIDYISMDPYAQRIHDVILEFLQDSK